VFSPYYAAARRRGRLDPCEHCAFNVALYPPHGGRWTMTERRGGSLQRAPDRLVVGPSSLAWDGDTLVASLDELAAPLPRRVRGELRLRPTALTDHAYSLDEGGRHRWSPIAPTARIEVRLDSPALHWTGTAYSDSNAGDEPLENAFRSWQWSRAAHPDGAAVLYDVIPRAGAPRTLALQFDRAGGVREVLPPPLVTLRTSGWGLRRATRSERGAAATLLRTLEDGPFYARSLVSARLGGERLTSVHESVSLDRFRSRWVQLLLPFRMPRARR
jgi:carotenoid 1,2-hydratase